MSKQQYRVIGSQPINVAAGRFVHGDFCTLTAAEALNLQRAGAVEPVAARRPAASRQQTSARAAAAEPSTQEQE